MQYICIQINIMENSLKGLILAAGTIITCIVISLGFYISREAKSTASTGASEINRLNTEFSESDKVIYEGSSISGSEVVSAIRKMDGQSLGVCVVTKSASTFYGYDFNTATGELGKSNSTKYSNSTGVASNTYINPYASFKGQLVRNSNNVITGIVFTQV